MRDARDIKIISKADELLNQIQFEADIESNAEDGNSRRLKKLRSIQREASNLKILIEATL